MASEKKEKPLIKLLREDSIDWTKISNRARSNLQEVTIAVIRGLIDRDPPLDVFEEVISLNPGCLKDDYSSWNCTGTPLSYVIQKGARIELAQTILRVQKNHNELFNLSKTTADSHLRLFQTLNFEELSLETMRALLKVHPQGALESPDRTGENIAERCIFRSDHKNTDYWEKMNLVMRAAVLGTIEQKDGDNFLLLHSVLELICGVGTFQEYRPLPPLFCVGRLKTIKRILKLIKNKVPEQCRARDASGSLPLHIVAGATAVDNTGRAAKVVRFLLEECPESARALDAKGRLPLHLAAANKVSGMEIIADAEPRALDTRCGLTRMYPFQLASVSYDEKNHTKSKSYEATTTNRIYKMLSMSPLVARGLAADPSKEWWIDTPEYKELLRNRLKMSELELRNSKLKRKLDEMKASSM